MPNTPSPNDPTAAWMIGITRLVERLNERVHNHTATVGRLEAKVEESNRTMSEVAAVLTRIADLETRRLDAEAEARKEASDSRKKEELTKKRQTEIEDLRRRTTNAWLERIWDSKPFQVILGLVALSILQLFGIRQINNSLHATLTDVARELREGEQMPELTPEKEKGE